MVDNNIAANAAALPTLTILKEHQRNAAVKDSLNKVPTSTHPTSVKSRATPPPVIKPSGQPKAVMKKPNG